MTWKLWREVNGCRIMRKQQEHHPAGYFEYEVFAPDGFEFDGGEHSLIEYEEKDALVAAHSQFHKCALDCDNSDVKGS